MSNLLAASFSLQKLPLNIYLQENLLMVFDIDGHALADVRRLKNFPRFPPGSLLLPVYHFSSSPSSFLLFFFKLWQTYYIVFQGSFLITSDAIVLPSLLMSNRFLDNQLIRLLA